MDGFGIKSGQSFSNQFSDIAGSGKIDKQFQIQSPTGSSSEVTSFADTLIQAIGKVDELQKTADKSMQNLATGRSDNIADVMIAAEKAEIGLKVMVQVRNKIIDAYQEMMRMQV